MGSFTQSTYSPSIFLFILLIISPVIISAVSVEEDLTLTFQQKRALDKFKARIMTKLPEKYMKHEIYLIRFLRAKNFDVKMAEEFLLEHLKWRKEYKMNQILDEDFSDLEEDYQAYVETIDKEGRPSIFGNIGDWDIRKAAATGKLMRLRRHVVRIFEEATTKVRTFQTEGKNVTQWNFLVNMNNYNVLQHGCVPCVSFYIHLVNIYEHHYPAHAHTIMLVNTPPIFQTVLNALKPFMSARTRSLLQVYGHNKAQWQPELYKTVDKSELPPELGGTKIYGNDLKK